MIVIAGLGNPGEKYKNTPHNIGFMITSAMAEKYGIALEYSSKFKAFSGKGKYKNTEIFILQPQTYMNLSGESVSSVLNWYKLNTDNLFVVLDDINIDFGRIRFRGGGSAGNHNGLESIITICNSSEFPRLKIGIGPAPPPQFWSSFVLRKFNTEESENIKKFIPVIIEGIEAFLEEGIISAMNKYNGVLL